MNGEEETHEEEKKEKFSIKSLNIDEIIEDPVLQELIKMEEYLFGDFDSNDFLEIFKVLPVTTESDIKFISHLFCDLCKTRPYNIEKTVDLILYLSSQYDPETNHLDDLIPSFKNIILYNLTNHYKTNYFAENPSFVQDDLISVDFSEEEFILNLLYEKGYVTEQEVIKVINGKSSFFLHFVHEKYPNYYKSFSIVHESEIRNQNAENWSIDELSANDWELQKKLCRTGQVSHPLYQAIFEDDLEKLQSLISTTYNNNFDTLKIKSIFERSSIVKLGIKLINFASFCGSLKCFKYLYLNQDRSHIDLSYAIAGGNVEIIKICHNCAEMDLKIYSSQLLKTTIMFHRPEIFIWAFENNQQLIQKLLNDVFPSTSKYNNIATFEYIIQNIDLSTTEYYLLGECLRLAIINNNNRFARFLMKHFEKIIFYEFYDLYTQELLDSSFIYYQHYAFPFLKNCFTAAIEQKNIEVFNVLYHDTKFYEFLDVNYFDLTEKLAKSDFLPLYESYYSINVAVLNAFRNIYGAINSMILSSSYECIHFLFSKFIENEITEERIKEMIEKNFLLLDVIKRPIDNYRIGEFILSFKPDVNTSDQISQLTALNLACKYEQHNMIDILIENNADVNTTDKYKNTPLHYSSAGKNVHIVENLLKQPTININAQNENLETALHIAAKNGYLDIVKILQEHGANVNIKNKNHKTPYDLANNDEVRIYLSQFKRNDCNIC
ncbi:hypothetical protein TRFO_34409 [Tritrichomonas foetus]|uniref:Uncharacterized protein n=1 Tax=Tritrichomonas foetus TaxID=1144522 RepID=A0A1J4JNS5_9EUKA|nr:hypothetical protein TRFO_34409 [Tritrichomonas foetus]|eukprot:OHS99173.1 hypothetical protein TRFO_34409 [Tritrichomonas foetus]